MSELKVNKVTPRSGTTVTLGDSGDTITIPSGATITNSGTATGFGGANTPAFQAKNTTAFSVTNATAVKIEYNTEDFDTDSCYDNVTNYRFTPNVAGKYFVYARFAFDSDSDFDEMRLKINKNASTFAESLTRNEYYSFLATYAIVELNGTTDYVEAFTEQHSGTAKNSLANVNGSRNVFGAYRIIE